MTSRRRLLAFGIGIGLALAIVGPALAGGRAPEVMRPIVTMRLAGQAHAAAHKPVRSAQLSFNGGNPGVVKGTDKVYLVFWGSQWTGNDPSGEATILTSFFNHVGGSSWNASVTQYCDGVPSGTVTCGASGNHATNPAAVLGGTWNDNSVAAPAHPSQGDLAGEAIRAAAHFGNTSPGSNNTVQYAILTATGNNASGAGSSYCAWHSWTNSTYGNIAYTNMPYVTDYGASCGAGFNGLSQTAGITIVEGHEFAETESDIFPSSGWIDRNGAENADKCAWISGSGTGATKVVTFGNTSFPVQALWSNAFNSNAGGCVQSYP